MAFGFRKPKLADGPLNMAVRRNTQFALDLYARLRSESGNLFFSPYSLSVALAMTFAGARGETETQMAMALRFDADQEQIHRTFSELQARFATVQDEGFVQLQVANALWPQLGYRFLDEYLELLQQQYGVSVAALDYGVPEPAREAINAWVERTTEGKIEELIGPGVLNPRTRLVLTNAIYFRGDWAQQFDETQTKLEAFWLAPSEKVDVPTMSQVDTFGYSRREPGLQILELPYAGEDLSMLLLLPETMDGISELEETLTAENLQRWTNNLNAMEVAVHIPRFTVRCQFSLSEALKSFGIVDAFGGAADFSGMDGSRELFLSAVIHQAYVDVNEEGTEAAAATAALMATMSVPAPPPVFRADHPFVLLIWENSTGSILFMGRVSNPLAGDG